MSLSRPRTSSIFGAECLESTRTSISADPGGLAAVALATATAISAGRLSSRCLGRGKPPGSRPVSPHLRHLVALRSRAPAPRGSAHGGPRAIHRRTRRARCKPGARILEAQSSSRAASGSAARFGHDRSRAVAAGASPSDSTDASTRRGYRSTPVAVIQSLLPFDAGRGSSDRSRWPNPRLKSPCPLSHVTFPKPVSTKARAPGVPPNLARRLSPSRLNRQRWAVSRPAAFAQADRDCTPELAPAPSPYPSARTGAKRTRRGFCFVVDWAVSDRLPLGALGGLKEKPGPGGESAAHTARPS